MAHVLIADDVAAVREALARPLRERGHRVTLAADGQEAVDRFVKDRADVAVLDVYLPRVPGVDVAARLKGATGPHTRVMMLSARTDLDTRLAALAVGDDFLGKPCDPSELVARVEAQLRTRRVIEDLRSRAGGDGATDGERGEPRLLDRAGLLERLDEEWKRSARSSEPLTVLVAVVDNGGRGPTVGAGSPPLVLAAAVQRCLRSLDLVGRIGDDLVGAVLLNTHLTGTLVAIDRLRRELRKVEIEGATPVVSIGVAVHPGCEADGGDPLLRLAEAALSRARAEGPGAVCLQQAQLYVYRPVE